MLDGLPPKDESVKLRRKQRLAWENGFQAYSDKMWQDETTPSGKCGYMSFCDYCEDNSYGRPCVRAFNQYIKDRNITVDYSDTDYDKWI